MCIRIFGNVIAELVGRAVRKAAFDAAAGLPDREAMRMMVATKPRRPLRQRQNEGNPFWNCSKKSEILVQTVRPFRGGQTCLSMHANASPAKAMLPKMNDAGSGTANASPVMAKPPSPPPPVNEMLEYSESMSVGAAMPMKSMLSLAGNIVPFTVVIGAKGE